MNTMKMYIVKTFVKIHIFVYLNIKITSKLYV